MHVPCGLPSVGNCRAGKKYQSGEGLEGGKITAGLKELGKIILKAEEADR